MTRSKNKGQLAVSLFPFLTVLICTMGVLIVMLVIAVKAADQSTKTDSKAKAEKLTAELRKVQLAREVHQIRSDAWQQKRIEVAAQSKLTRQLNDFLKNELSDLEARKAELAKQFLGLQSTPAYSTEKANTEIDRLESERLILENELAVKQRQSQTAAPATVYSVVPYFGSNSTDRRPIYVECTATKIILQPFGVELSEEDFSDDLSAGNPFDTALETIRQYWIRHHPLDIAGDPYPLLIVRPNGGGAYSLARRAMISWVDEFGYELVRDDLILDFGDSDPALSAEIKESIKQAKIAAVAKSLQRKQLERQLLPHGASVADKQPSAAGGGLEIDVVNGGFKKSRSHSSSMSKGDYVANTAVAEREKGTLAESQEKQAEANGSAKVRESQVSSQENNPSGNPNALGAEGNSPGGSTNTVSCLADRLGKNWALPQLPGRTVGYRRPIKIYCLSDQLLMLPEFGSNDEKLVVPLKKETSESVAELVAQVRKKIESWGPAAEQGYWKPVMEFKVVPGGEERFRDLKILLKDSGLELGGDGR